MSTPTPPSYQRLHAVPLRSLPYPAGLGKTAWPQLRDPLRTLMARDYTSPDAHRDALESSREYRDILDEHLLPAFPDVASVASRAFDIGRRLQHFGATRAVPPADLVGELREASQTTSDVRVADWLRDPPSVAIRSDGSGILTDGRHRITAMRASLCDPDMPVLIITEV